MLKTVILLGLVSVDALCKDMHTVSDVGDTITGTDSTAECQVSAGPSHWMCRGPGTIPADIVSSGTLLDITFINGTMLCNGMEVRGYDGYVALGAWNSYTRRLYLYIEHDGTYKLSLNMQRWMVVKPGQHILGSDRGILLAKDAVITLHRTPLSPTQTT